MDAKRQAGNEDQSSGKTLDADKDQNLGNMAAGSEEHILDQAQSADEDHTQSPETGSGGGQIQAEIRDVRVFEPVGRTPD